VFHKGRRFFISDICHSGSDKRHLIKFRGPWYNKCIIKDSSLFITEKDRNNKYTRGIIMKAVSEITEKNQMAEELGIVFQSSMGTAGGRIGVKVRGGIAPYTYSWFRNGSIKLLGSEPVFTADASGLYFCVIRDGSGNTVLSRTVEVKCSSLLREGADIFFRSLCSD
jgi:hypothetical protein